MPNNPSAVGVFFVWLVGFGLFLENVCLSDRITDQ